MGQLDGMASLDTMHADLIICLNYVTHMCISLV